MQWLLLSQGMGSRPMGSVVAGHGSRAQAQELWCTGLAALQRVGSSWSRARTHASCTGRRALPLSHQGSPLLTFLKAPDMGSFLCLGCWRPGGQSQASLAASSVGTHVAEHLLCGCRGWCFNHKMLCSGSTRPRRSGVLEDPGLSSPCKSLELS